MDSIENGGRLVVGGVDALAVRRSDLRLTQRPAWSVSGLLRREVSLSGAARLPLCVPDDFRKMALFDKKFRGWLALAPALGVFERRPADGHFRRYLSFRNDNTGN